MVVLDCPRARWSLAADGRGWTTSAGERRKVVASCWVPRIRSSCSGLSTDLVLFSPILLRRIDTTAASAFGRPRPPASTFPSKGISEQADGDLQHDAAESATATKCLIAHALPKAAGENLNEVAQSQTADELPKASAESSSDKAHSQTAYESPKSVAEMQKLEVADRRTAVESLKAVAEAQKPEPVQNREAVGSLEGGEETQKLEVADRQTPVESLEAVAEAQKLEPVQNREAVGSLEGGEETQKLEVADRQTPVESLEAVAEAQKLEPVQNREAVGFLEGGGETQKLEVADRQTPVESLEAVAEAQKLEPVQNPGSPKGGGETIAMPEAIPVQAKSPNLPKTVQVKFTLQKSCRFGEQFLLLGAGTSLGQWDVANAIPLEWSDGHVWIAEMGLPVEEEIKFKFVRRELSGKLAWQPGPDRILRTWETTNTIIVAGEWENADDQKIKEEEPSAIPAPGEFSEERDDDVVRNGEVLIAAPDRWSK